MRDIKFRAWNKHTGRMVDLYRATPLTLEPDLKQDGLFIPFGDDFILEQFADLQDKNGNDIYDGDIVEGDWVSRDNEEHLVCAVTIGGGYVYPFTEGTGYSSGFLYDTNISSRNFKIIGNIHENPELIGGDA